MRVHLEFIGDAAELIFLLIFAGLSLLLVIPGAWGVSSLLSWTARHTLLHGGHWVQFNGRGGEIAWAFILMFVSYAGGCVILFVVLSKHTEALLLYIALGYFLVFLVVCLVLWYMIIKWAVNSIEFSWGAKLQFHGKFRTLLFLTVTMLLSLPLIFAPAFVCSSFIRWICSYSFTDMDDRLVWKGKGAGILWRDMVIAITGVFILPLPWTLRMLLDYIISSVQVDRSPGLVRKERELESLELLIND